MAAAKASFADVRCPVMYALPLWSEWSLSPDERLPTRTFERDFMTILQRELCHELSSPIDRHMPLVTFVGGFIQLTLTEVASRSSALRKVGGSSQHQRGIVDAA